MASQIEAQPTEYRDLLTSMNNLDEENEPFTYDKPGWVVMEPQQKLAEEDKKEKQK